MKIQYLLMPSLMLNPLSILLATNDDLKDVTNSISYSPLKSEKRLARAFDKSIGEYIDEYTSIMNENKPASPSKNKHEIYTLKSNYEKQLTDRIENLANRVSLMTAIKDDPHEDMELVELAQYQNFGSSLQRLMVTEILIQREEIDEALEWEYLTHPFATLMPYDIYYGRMLIMLLDYGLLHMDPSLTSSLLKILKKSLKVRLNNWAFSSHDYLNEIGYEYMDRVRRIFREKIFDDKFREKIDSKFLKDKKWHEIGRYSFDLMKTQIDTVSFVNNQPVTPLRKL